MLDSAGAPIVGGVDALLIAIVHPIAGAGRIWPAAFALLGSLIGSSILFFLAKKGGDVFLHKQVSAGPGKRLHAWFQQYGLITVFRSGPFAYSAADEDSGVFAPALCRCGLNTSRWCC